MPARQPARRRPTRRPPPRPIQRTAPVATTPDDGAPEAALPGSAPVSSANQPRPSGASLRAQQMSSARMAMAARATELARLDVLYLKHDLRNVGVIAFLMLAAVVGLTFLLH